MARDARDALDLQHTQRRNFNPLRNGLFGDVQGSSEASEAAGCFYGAIQRCV